TATFSVSFDAEPYPDFAWYKDGVLLPDATGPILTLNGVTTADAGSYHVVLSNVVGGEPQSATSDPAVLSVIPQPVQITTQPAPQTVSVGSPVSFSVTVAGTPPFTYQWYGPNGLI
ncbi:immunoglobulin domain-containing protein, partial [Arthrospira platensis SPKY1]|nr:immunoglobulin domain-containing protein [Arthrospira platensis SPKY1]